jgi:hypothetical protein
VIEGAASAVAVPSVGDVAGVREVEVFCLIVNRPGATDGLQELLDDEAEPDPVVGRTAGVNQLREVVDQEFLG